MNDNLLDVFKDYELPFQTFFSKGVHSKNQVHDEVELIWVLRGSVHIVCDAEQYTLGPQTLFMVNIGQLHDVDSSEDSVIITYRFRKEHLIEHNVSFSKMHFENRVYTLRELVKKYKEVPHLITQLLGILISPSQSNVVRYRIIGYYNMFIYELYTMLLKERYMDIKKKNYDSYMKRVNTVTTYVQENFRKKISLDELAKKVKLSKYRLSHFIKDYLGISLQEYVKNVRLDHALTLLRNTKESVIEIARNSGFSDVKYLNSSLKDRLGLTALKYRKLIKEDVKLTTEDSDEFKNELRTCLRTLEQTIGIGGTV